ncbi:MAG: hypothetical protein GX316_10655 [Firmicutes bacterium]|nr:hypothetical protein [Bacillota bacterium]
MNRFMVVVFAVILATGAACTAFASEQLLEGRLAPDLAGTMQVELNVSPYAMLKLTDMHIALGEPGDEKVSTVGFEVGTNTSVRVNVTSRGFDPENADDWVLYNIKGDNFYLKPGHTVLEEYDFDPGNSVDTETLLPGVWTGTITATAAWNDEDWTAYTAGQYKDEIYFTIEQTD